MDDAFHINEYLASNLSSITSNTNASTLGGANPFHLYIRVHTRDTRNYNQVNNSEVPFTFTFMDPN